MEMKSHNKILLFKGFIFIHMQELVQVTMSLLPTNFNSWTKNINIFAIKFANNQMLQLTFCCGYRRNGYKALYVQHPLQKKKKSQTPTPHSHTVIQLAVSPLFILQVYPYIMVSVPSKLNVCLLKPQSKSCCKHWQRKQELVFGQKTDGNMLLNNPVYLLVKRKHVVGRQF